MLKFIVCGFVGICTMFWTPVQSDQYGLTVKNIECNSESEINSMDWLCELKPIRRGLASVANSGRPFKDNIYGKIDLLYLQNGAYIPYLFNRTLNVCNVHEELSRTYPNYKFMSLLLGTTTREICPLLNTLVLRNMQMEKIELPSNMPPGNYKLDTSIYNDQMEYYLDINIYFSLKSLSMFSFLANGQVDPGMNPNQNPNVYTNNGQRRGGGGGRRGGNGPRRNDGQQYSPDY